MDNLGLGAGLAAIAFWGFVAVAVVASVWNGIRKREAQHETVRRLVESGQQIDAELLAQLSTASGDSDRRPDREMLVTAYWMLPVSVGMAVFAVILGMGVPEAFYPLLGAAALVGCMGLGWLAAAKVIARWYVDREAGGD